MGCGLVAVVPAAQAAAACTVLSPRHPGAAPIGRVTAEAGRVALPGLGLAGTADGLARA